MHRLLALSLLAAACQTPEPSGTLFDTGSFSPELSVVVWEGNGWLGSPVRRPSTGWPTAACLDVTRDGACDPSAEPFAPCDGDGDRIVCSPRPWKATITRTQVFDGVIVGDVLSLVDRDHEMSIHATFAPFTTDGAPAPRTSMCWSQRQLCSTAVGSEPPPPLKLCGAEKEGIVDLELRYGDESRTVHEPVPERVVLAGAIEPRGTESVVVIDANQELAQALIQLREEAPGTPGTVIWSGTPRRSRADRSKVELSVPDDILASLHSPDRSLLVQLVAARRRPTDDLLLVQRATEVRIWIRAVEVGP